MLKLVYYTLSDGKDNVNNDEQKSCPRRDFLFENGCVLN